MLDFKQAASSMIDTGATDDEIKTVIGNMKNYASQMIDEGKPDAEIVKTLQATTWNNKPIFTPSPQAQAVAQGVRKSRTYIPHGGGGYVEAPTNQPLSPVEKKIGSIALPTAGGAIGGAVGGPGGLIAGTMIGAGVSQALGLEEPSLGSAMLSGVGAAVPGVGKVAQQTGITGKLATAGKYLAERFVPGVAAYKLHKGAETIIKDIDRLVQVGQPRKLWEGFKRTVGNLTIPQAPATKAALVELSDDIITTSKGIPGGSQVRTLVAGMSKTYNSTKPLSLTQLDNDIKTLGAAVGALERSGGVTLGPAKKLLAALHDDLENAPLTMTTGAAQTEAVVLLRKSAAAATKKQYAKKELLETVAKSITPVAGVAEGDVLKAAPAMVKQRILALTTPEHPSFDANFTSALKNELPKIMGTIESLNKLSSGLTTTSLVTQSLLATGAGGLLGAVAGSPGMAAGAMLGAMSPRIMADVLLSRAGRAIMDKGLSSMIPERAAQMLPYLWNLAYQTGMRAGEIAPETLTSEALQGSPQEGP